MKAIVVHNTGSPVVLTSEDIPQPEPKSGEVLVKLAAIGVNFIDVYYRSGLYPFQLPMIPGMEAAGEVVASGAGVADFKVGDRVAYSSQLGSYAEYAVVPAEKLVPVPDAIDDRTAAAAMLQGMTAQYLSTSTYHINPGDSVLIHAAAGGVGLLLTQVARYAGAHVIGTVSTEEKAQLAGEAGADDVILYTQNDFEAEVLRLTDSKGVNVVYDSVGKTTFLKSLNCLQPCGYMVLFGQSSGKVEPVDPTLLGKKSLFLTRPYLFDYIRERSMLVERSKQVFEWITNGALNVRIGGVYPLAEAARAHKDLESRATTGKLLLIP